MTTLLCSPSQAKTADLCPRLWGFRYLDKVRSPPTPGQATGTKLHTVGENWLSKGTIPPANDIGKMFLAGIQHLPEPSEDLLVEHSFLFEDGDVHWRGFIDCVDPTSDVTLVLDHKSTKSLYWAMKPEKLLKDFQGILYAKATMDEFGVDEVEARWVYYVTQGKPESKKVSVILKRDHVEKEYQKLKLLGEELLEIKKTTTTGLDIPVKYPNPGCRAFGGCDFGEICAAKKEGKDMSDLLSRLKKMKDNGVENNVQALHAAVNPPTTVEEKPQPAKVTTRTTIAMDHDYIDPNAAVGSSEIAMQAVDHAPDKTAACDEPAPQPKKRGRPKGSKNRKKVKDAAPEVVAKEKKAVVQEQAPKSTTDSTGTDVGSMAFAKEGQHPFTLYIDCIPDSGATSVNKLLEKAAEMAALEADVSHYRLIPYGAGAGSLCAKFKELCWGQDYIKGNWYMSTNNQLHKDAMPALEELASSIVRGTK